MSACSFTFPFTAPAAQVLNKARSAVQSQGGNFTGDERNGNFDVSIFGNTITGSYAVEGTNLQITIHEKPFLVSCGMIESFLQKQIV